MKIRITLLLLILSSGFMFSQIINIPDPIFKNRLIEEGVDSNNDGEIQESEALIITDLDIRANGSDPKITNLEGIQFFINLEFFNCRNNSLTTIDVSTLTSLIEFNCADNQLNTLDVSTLASLEFLKAYGNQLTSINVYGLNNLIYLWIFSNQLETIDVNTLTNLVWLDCFNNTISELNISNLINLKYLWAHNNQLNFIDFLPLSNLESIALHNNYLTNIDVSHISSLRELILDNNNLTELDLSNLTNLKTVTVSKNDIYELDCSTTIAQLVSCGENPNLHSINVQNNVISISDPIVADSGLNFQILPNLESICMDPGEEQALSHSGYDPDNVTVFTGPNCTLSLDEFSLKETYIYPNPIKDNFTINTNVEIKNYTLIDVTGKTISQSNNINEIEETVMSLSNGLYFLKLESSTRDKTTIKFLKE